MSDVVQEQLKSKVVRIYGDDKQFLGSGYIVKNGSVITCSHVVNDTNSCYVGTGKLLSEKPLVTRCLDGLEIEYTEIGNVLEILEPANKIFDDSIRQHDLQMLSYNGGSSTGIELDINCELEIGEKIIILGFTDPSYSDSLLVMGAETLGEKFRRSDQEYHSLMVFPINTIPMQGMSGGPAICANDRSTLRGIVRGYEPKIYDFYVKNERGKIKTNKESAGHIIDLSPIRNRLRNQKKESDENVGLVKVSLFGVFLALLSSFVNAIGFNLSKGLQHLDVSVSLNVGASLLVAGAMFVALSLAKRNFRAAFNNVYLLISNKNYLISFLMICIWTSAEFYFVIKAIYILSPTFARALVACSPFIAVSVIQVNTKIFETVPYGTTVLLFVLGSFMVGVSEISQMSLVISSIPIGLIAAFIGATTWILYIQEKKKLIEIEAKTGCNLGIFRLGLIYLLVGLAFLSGETFKESSFSLNYDSLYMLFANGLRVGVVYFAFQEALKKVDSILLDIIVGLGVLFTFVIEMLIFDRPFDDLAFAGILLVIVALGIIRIRVIDTIKT